jgi:hypothetical protein
MFAHPRVHFHPLVAGGVDPTGGFVLLSFLEIEASAKTALRPGNDDHPCERFQTIETTRERLTHCAIQGVTFVVPCKLDFRPAIMSDEAYEIGHEWLFQKTELNSKKVSTAMLAKSIVVDWKGQKEQHNWN